MKGALGVAKEGKLKGDGERVEMLKAFVRKEDSYIGTGSLAASCDLSYSKKVQQKLTNLWHPS